MTFPDDYFLSSIWSCGVVKVDCDHLEQMRGKWTSNVHTPGRHVTCVPLGPFAGIPLWVPSRGTGRPQGTNILKKELTASLTGFVFLYNRSWFSWGVFSSQWKNYAFRSQSYWVKILAESEVPAEIRNDQSRKASGKSPPPGRVGVWCDRWVTGYKHPAL